ncbi:hypothetical protein [Novosphingobium sp. 9]|uniref:hypothetical protein n=1 Tax=Novosphingobium sp. 9 TaxID=2025349 RepID=UPI0021B57E68|nr:hypothetical protein [Novosphingobium sp. 9]
MIALPLLASAVGPVLLRYGWQRERWPVLLGWLILAFAAVALLQMAGARGLALGITAAMASAAVIVCWAGWQSPAPKVRAPRKKRERTEPSAPPPPPPKAPMDWRGLGRRIAVFLLCGPVALAACAFAAWALQRMAWHGGWREANSSALALFGLPLLWICVMSWQMIATGLKGKFIPLLVTTVIGGTLCLAA